MRKLTLYIAVSLDGYIADEDAGVDWLDDAAGEVEDNGYGDFIQSVDTVIMGRRTYDQVTTQLSPDVWPYEGLRTYVLTHRALEEREDIRRHSGPLAALVEELCRREGKDIWLCGGADLVRQALDAGLLDRICLTIMPILLGEGTPLFARRPERMGLELVSHRELGGMIECIYDIK